MKHPLKVARELHRFIVLVIVSFTTLVCIACHNIPCQSYPLPTISPYISNTLSTVPSSGTGPICAVIKLDWAVIKSMLGLK